MKLMSDVQHFCQRPDLKGNRRGVGVDSWKDGRPLTRLLTAYSRPLFINVAVTGQSRSASAVRAASLRFVRRNCKDGQRFHAPLDVKGLNQREEGEQSSFDESQFKRNYIFQRL